MKRNKHRIPLSLIALALGMSLLFSGCQKTSAAITDDATDTVILDSATETIIENDTTDTVIDENGAYTAKDDVASYLYTYGHLPANFITKKEARSLGWEGGSLEPYAPGKCIGGDVFGNYEELLPTDTTYHECDIDTLGAKSRGAKRIVYAEDGCIYYTEDHYESFEKLYDEDGEL